MRLKPPCHQLAHCYANPQDILAADRQLLNRPISKVLKFKRSAKTKFLRGIRRAHRRFLAERLERQYTIRHFFDPSVPTTALIDPHLRVPLAVLLNPTPVLRLSKWTRPG